MRVQTNIPPHVKVSQQNNVSVNPLLVSGGVFLSILFVLAIIGYRQSKTQILRRRIAKLERIWLLSSAKKTF